MNVPVNIFQKKCKKNIHNRLNILQLEVFKFLCLFIEESLRPNINKEKHKELCSSINNSKSINQYIENITRIRLPEFLTDTNTKWEEYCGEHMADTSLTLKDCVIHVDNKGVEVKKKETKLIVKEMKQLCDDNNISYKELENKKKRIGYEELLTRHELTCVRDTEYEEQWRDHEDVNLHFKSSQTNLHGFEGNASKKICIFNGKMPRDIQKPHFTYIIKHVYSKEIGIHKIILYSIPHCYSQPKYYPDIQKDHKKKKKKERTPKAPDEFRFNMNDSNDKPYTFIDSDIQRYKVFTYTSF